MDDMAGGAQVPAAPAQTLRAPAPLAQERPVGELVKLMSGQVLVLVRGELRLARLEMVRKGEQVGAGIGMLSGGGLVALYGLACLIACVVLALSEALAVWLSALIVGVALLAVAGIAALMGKGRLPQAAPPVPGEAVSSVKADVEEIRERARR
jgi:uncharacterized membrane protein YqjE